MKTSNAPRRTILALSTLAVPSLWAFDPLLDEPEPVLAWSLSKDVSYTASSTPTWEAANRVAASHDFAIGSGTLELGGSLGALIDDFQLDSAWSLEPGASVGWTSGRLSLEGWGWGLWNDLGWTDEGGGSSAAWLLGSPDAPGARWSASVHGWLSGNSGSAMGLGISRRSHGERWSTRLSLTARRLWDVESVPQRPSGVRQSLPMTATTDQWQTLVQAGVDRNWQHVSAGVGIDLDARASDAVATTSRSGRGKGASSTSSAFRYSGTLDPYATLSWSPGAWSFTLTSGYTTELQRSKDGIEPIYTPWTSVGTSVDW